MIGNLRNKELAKEKGRIIFDNNYNKLLNNGCLLWLERIEEKVKRLRKT